MLAARHGRLAHNIGERNAVQKAMHIGVLVLIVVVGLSGLSIWKPVQFQELTALFGGYDVARYVHFFCMAAIVLSLVVHLSLTLLVPKVLPPMVTGWARAGDERNSRARSPGLGLQPRGAGAAHRLRRHRREAVHETLWAMSKWNDRVQGWLFNPNKLAPVFPESAITKPFPFNAYYDEDEVPMVNAARYKLALSGLIRDKKPWTLAQLRALPQSSQITRHVCVEGWSAIGKWSGVPLRTFLERVGADLTAKYVGFRCLDDYYTSIDMATALHPQTQLTLKYADQTLPAKLASR